MKILLFPLLLFPAVFFAQKKEKTFPIPKMDTSKIQNQELPGKVSINPSAKKKDFYTMMVSQPKDTVVYIALKESPKDDSRYKILNAVKPEKYNTNIEKAMPSK
ncbi:hypothetical protein LF887_10165 [Chryseobacterium sp. MEBOG06]|uniref:hypothetical protein n=1 Tax=Chryseobacterium sp. MEBOG06 TaxID=2879938 RepID=UPI001F1C302D|nr:hypothetical protein [Chryseobacterium sp. MEBOG06]UKB85965.1 hypothetical protein LF887_10165 [Chryseobacterium sp. MEBOG06]